jgi:hypothetical protein
MLNQDKAHELHFKKVMMDQFEHPNRMKTLSAITQSGFHCIDKIKSVSSRTAPTLVFLLMLACRLVVDWQMAGKDDDDEEEGEVVADETTKGVYDEKVNTTVKATKGKTKNVALGKTKKEN